jgi:hypothetical protein
MAALSAPWFLNADYFRAYSNDVFANNAALPRGDRPRQSHRSARSASATAKW